MIIVVLHQTISDSKAFLNSAPTANYSYHAFIDRTGKITYMVSPVRSAIACANCQITGVNNVDKHSYQICFESLIGDLTHNQYMSLGYLLSQLGVSLKDVYSHSEISSSTDLSLLDREKVLKAFNKFPANKTIYTGLE